MPGAHPPQAEWVAVGVEVRGMREDNSFEIATILGVDQKTAEVLIHWRGGGLDTLPFSRVWQTDPPLPVLLQQANPLFVDPVALARTDGALRLQRQYALRHSRKQMQNAQTLLEACNVPADILDIAKKAPKKGVANVFRRRKIVRCACGWNRVITPMMIACDDCRCLSHCVCVGMRSPENESGKPGKAPLKCIFCDNSCARPTRILPCPPPPLSNKNYQIPISLIQQRLFPTSVPTQKNVFFTMQNCVKTKLTARGYSVEVILGGRHCQLDCDTSVQECVDVCSSAVADGYFDHRYPQNAFSAMRLDPCSRVTVVREVRTGKAVAVLASSGNDCPLFLKSTCVTLQRAIVDPQASSYLDLTQVDALRNLAAMTNHHNIVHLSLVATQKDHRKRGLGSMLMLYDMAGWAAEGRTQMYLNMTLLRKTVGKEKKAAFFYSIPSKHMYERYVLLGFFVQKVA